MSSSKEVCLHFFANIIEDDEPTSSYKCNVSNCGAVLKQKSGSGWTNLHQHLKAAHSEELEKYKKSGAPFTQTCFMDPKAKNIYNWIDWVVEKNLPFNWVEDKLTRQYSNLKEICTKTLKKYMEAVQGEVEDLIKKELPNKFGIIFDGWSFRSEGYYGVFASYPKGSSTKCPLLALQPIPDYGEEEEEDYSQKAEDILQFMKGTVEYYGKKMENILFWVGDNCATNRRLADISGIPIVGCASHRLNLAVQKWLSE